MMGLCPRGIGRCGLGLKDHKNIMKRHLSALTKVGTSSAMGRGVIGLSQIFLRLARSLVAAGVVLASGVALGADAAVKPAVSAELSKLVDLSNQQRDRMIAEHDALARQLRDATEEKRREIYEKMSEQKKAFEAAQSALHKRIREEQRAQRSLQRSR